MLKPHRTVYKQRPQRLFYRSVGAYNRAKEREKRWSLFWCVVGLCGFFLLGCVAALEIAQVIPGGP